MAIDNINDPWRNEEEQPEIQAAPPPAPSQPVQEQPAQQEPVADEQAQPEEVAPVSIAPQEQVPAPVQQTDEIAQQPTLRDILYGENTQKFLQPGDDSTMAYDRWQEAREKYFADNWSKDWEKPENYGSFRERLLKDKGFYEHQQFVQEVLGRIKKVQNALANNPAWEPESGFDSDQLELLGRIVDSDKIRMDATPEGQQKLKALYDVLDTDADTAGSTSYEHTMADTALKGLVSGVDMVAGLFRTASEAVGGMVGNISSDEQKMRHLERNLFEAHEARPDNISSKNLFSSEASAADWADAVVYNLCEQLPLMAALEVGGAVAGLLGRGAAWGTKAIGAARSAEGFAVGMGTKAAAQTAAKAGAVETAAKVGANRAALLNTLHAAEVASRKIGAIATDFAVNLGDTFGTQVDNAIAADKDLGALDYALTVAGTGVKTGIDFITGKGMAAMAARTPISKMLTSEAKIAFTAAGDNAAMDALRFARATFLDAASETGQEIAQKAVDRTINRIRNKTWLMDGEQKATDAFWNDLDEGLGAGLATLVMGGAGSVGRYKAERKQIASDLKNGTGLFNDKTRAALNRFVRDANLSGNFSDLSPEDRMSLLSAFRAYAQQQVNDRAVNTTPDQIVAEDAKKGKTTSILEASQRLASVAASSAQNAAQYGRTVDELVDGMSEKAKAWFNAYKQGFQIESFEDYRKALASAKGDDQKRLKPSFDIEAAERNYNTCVARANADGSETVLFDDSPNGDGDGGRIWIRGYRDEDGEMVYTIGRMDGGVMPLTENENIRGSQMEGNTVDARDNAALDAALQFASDLSGWAEFQKAREDSMQAFANALVAKGGRNQGLNVRIVRSWNDLRDLENSNTLSDKAKATMQDRDSPNGLSQNWTGFSEGGIVFVNRSKVANPFQLAAILDHEGFHDKLSRMASEAMGKNTTLKIAGVSLNEIPPEYRRDAFVADLLGIDTTGGFTEELLGEIERAEEELAYGGEGARRSEMDREGLFRNFMRKNKMLSWLLPDYIAGETGIRPRTEQEVSDFLFTVLGVGSKDGKDGTVIYGQNPRGLDNTTPAGTTAASVMQKSRFESQKRAADNPVQAAVNEAMANGEDGGAAEPKPASTSTPTRREGGVEKQQKKQDGKAAPAPAKKEAKPAAEKPAAPKKEPAKKPAAEKPTKTEPVKTEPVVPEKPKAKPKTNEQVIAALDANGAFLKMPFKTKASPVNNNLVPKISANQAIANYSGRRVVVVELNGVRVPFYLSTGNGRKATVQDGKWYPFFGIGSDGWMNKGTESQINEYYGSPELRAVASWLDENIGDIQPIGQSGPNMVSFDDGGNADFVNFISRDLVPIRHEKSGTKDGRETLDLSISNTVSRVRGANISSFVVAAKPAVQKTEAPAKPSPAAKKLPPVSNKGKPAVLRTLMPNAKAATKKMLDWLQKGTYTPGTYGKEPVRMIPMTYRSKGGEVVKSPIVVHNGRPYILLDMGGVSVPWYLNNAKTQWLPAIEGADSAKIGDKQILGSRSMHFVSQALMQEIGNGFAVIRGDDFKDYQTGKGETLDAVKMLDAEIGRKAIEAFTTKENDAVDPETLAPKQAEREDQSFEGRLREQKKAADPATKPEDLASLATSSDDSVRLEVASNPSTPKEALRVLATDTNAIVGSMARRRFTDAELKKIDADFEKATRSIANGTARGAQANVAETEKSGGKRRIGPRNRTEGKAKRNYVSIPKDIADAIAVAFRRNLGIKTETQESDPAGAKASAEKAAAYVKAEFKKLGMTDADISAHMGAFYDGVEDILKGGGAVAKESGKGEKKGNGKETKSLRADKRETTKPTASGSATNWTPPKAQTDAAAKSKTRTNAKGQKTLKTEPVKTEPVKTEPVAPAPQKKRGQSEEAKARVAAKKEADAAQRKANANKGEKKRSLKTNQRVDVSRFTTTGETDANGRPVLTKFGEALDTANSVLEGNRESLGGRVRRPTRNQLDPENMLVETMTLAESNALTFNYLVGQANTLLAVLDRPTVTQEEYDKLPQTERIKVATPEMKAKAKQRLERGDMSTVRGKTLKNLSEKRKEGKATEDEVAQLRSIAGQTERGIIPQLKALLGPEGRGVVDKMMRGEDVTADLGAAVDRWDAEQKERNIEGVQRWGASPGNARVLVNREERKATETDEKRAKREANRETMESEREGSQANAAEPAKQRKNLYDTPEKAAVAKFTQNDQKVLAQLKDPNGKSLADILYSVKVNRTYQRKDGTVTKTRNRRSGGVVASGIGAIQNPSVLNMIHIALRDALNSIDGQKFADGYERLLGEVEQRWRTVTGHDFNSTESDNIRKRFETFFPVGMDYNVAPRILSDEQREVMAEESGIIRKIDASGEAVDNFRLGDDEAFVQSLEDAYNSIQEDEGRDVRIQADRALDESGAYESNNQSDRVQQFRQGRASSIGSLLLSRVGDDYVLPNGQTKKQAMDGLREAIRRVGNRKWAELPDGEKDAIFDDTGWEMRADGEWGFRIPPIRFNEDFHEELERALLMEDRVEFNLLDVLDPDSAAMVEAMDDVQTVELDDGASIENRQFGDIKVVARPTDEADEHFGDTAWYDPINQEIVLTPAALDNAADSDLSLDLAITHEMQHVIQEAEGWSDRTPGNATSGMAYNNAMSEVDARAQEALLEQEYEDADAAAEGPLQATRQETVEDVARSEQIDGRMSSVQKKANATYPDAGAEIEAMPEGRASNLRSLMMVTLNNKRPDLDAQSVLDEVFKFPTTKERKIALHWIVRGGLVLPQDAYKVADALSVAEKAKVDPFRYKSPDELLLANKDFKPSARPIDPATVPELSDARDEGDGIVSYLVQDDRQGQAAMRRIIDTHWGEDANPWCLLSKQPMSIGGTTQEYNDWLAANEDRLTEEFINDTGSEPENEPELYVGFIGRTFEKEHNGRSGLLMSGNNLDMAWTFWQQYSSLPKRVAFKNGRLLAFMATERGQGDGKVEFSKPENERRVESFYKEYSKIDKDERPGNFQQWMMEEHPEEYDAIAEDEEDGGDAINTYQFQRVNEEWWDRQDESHPDLDWAKRDSRPSGRASSIASLIDAQGGGTAWEGRNSALKHRFRTWLGNHFQFDHDKKGFAAIFAEGQAIVGDNPAMAQGIVDRAVDNFENKEEWSPSAKELTVLYMEELCREMRYQDTVKAWEAANARGVSPVELEKARAEMVAARADMFLFAKALSFAKTGQGRALAANQMMLAEDFSFAGIVDRVNRALDTDRAAQRHPESRRPLAEEEIEKYGVIDYAKDVQDKQTALSDVEDAISEEDAQEAVQTAVGNAADRHGKERKAGRNPATVSTAVAAAKDTLAKRIGEGGWFDPSDYAETWGALHDIVKKVGDAIVGEAVDNGDETMSHDAFVERLAKEIDAIVRSIGGETAAEIADALEPMLYRDLYAGVGRLDKVMPTARSRKAAAIARMRELAMDEAELERVKAGELMPERFAKIGLKAEDVDEELAKVRAELSDLLRKSGMSSRNPNLKSTPLDRVKEGLEWQMADLQEAIDNNEALPRKAQGGVVLDEEAKQMRRRLAELRGIYDQHFGPKAEPMSDAQRLESLRQRLSEAAAQAEAMLADVTSGRWNPDAPTHAGRTYVADRTADALRAKIRDLRAAIESAKNQAAPEEMAQARLEAAIQAQQNRQARYESAINQGVVRKPRTFSLRETQDERWVNAFMAAEKAKKEFATLKGKILFDRKTALGKAWARANAIKDTMRAYMASGDISGLGVQCAWYVLQHPGKAMKTVIPGLRAFFSPEYAEKITRQIMADPDYRIMAEKMGVSFSLYGIESGFTQTEEAFARGEAARRLGSVSNNWYLDASERGFIVPINLCRYTLAKEYLETLRDMRGENGEIKADELKYLGRIVNITTGKGDFFGNAGASNFLSQILWAPSRVSSQVQILALPLTILGHDEIGKDMRMMIAKDAIARPIKHLAAIMLLTAMAGRLLRPDDDDEEIIGTDPTSSKFGKVKIGNRYISVTGGLEQYITILAKSITGFTRGKNGKKVDLRGGFGRNLEGEWLRLFKNKLRPDISMLWQWMVGRDNNGQTIGPGVWGKNGYLHFVARNGFIPLTGGDIYEALEDVNTNGVPLSMLFAAMAFVGWTGSNYGETPYTHDLARYNRAKEAMDEAQTEEEARLIAARPENHRYVGISEQLDANLKEQKQLESLLKNGEPAGKDLRGKKKYRPLFPREKERAKERLEELQIEFHQACWPDVYGREE